MNRVRLASLALALVAGCADGATTLRVDVRTDYVPGVEFAEVEVGVDSGGLERTYPVRFGEDFLSGVRVATLDDAPVGQMTLRARLNAADGRRIAERRVELDLRGNANSVTIVFTRACASISCPDGEDASATQCVGGRCVSPECSPETPEACGMGCSSADDCELMVAGCARAICDEGVCFVGSEVGACATGEFCHPDRGCTAEPVMMDGGVADGGIPADGGPDLCGTPCETGNACEVGVYDCSEGAPTCVRDTLVAAGTTCRESSGACDVEETCDGESPACPIDGFASTGTTCPAGFCDGLGTCSDGCTPGAPCSTGNACETGEISCASGTPQCVASGNATDGTPCGSTEVGTFGSCGGFSGACDGTGTRSRPVTAYACQAGTCEANTSNETEACTRNTEGSSCGTDMLGTWSSCSYSDACDESGTRSRVVTSYTCSAGTCGSSTSNETGSCTRDTDGVQCGSPTTGPWSRCLIDIGTDPCNDTGTQSATQTTYACSAGSCGSSSSTISQSCTESPLGRTCPNPEDPLFPCFKYRCSATGACVNTGTTCMSGEACCFDGCQPDTGGPCLL